MLRVGFLWLQRAGPTLRCGARALGVRTSVAAARGLSSCGSRALERRLSSCGARASLLRGMWDLPGPGLEPVSPALAGGLLTTAPPGKPLVVAYLNQSKEVWLRPKRVGLCVCGGWAVVRCWGVPSVPDGTAGWGCDDICGQEKRPGCTGVGQSGARRRVPWGAGTPGLREGQEEGGIQCPQPQPHPSCSGHGAPAQSSPEGGVLLPTVPTPLCCHLHSPTWTGSRPLSR